MTFALKKKKESHGASYLNPDNPHSWPRWRTRALPEQQRSIVGLPASETNRPALPHMDRVQRNIMIQACKEA
ncbi:uncharacterized protein CIMG_13581 [Coccidioides immitis RS]|uniref:Uncharacterized protein n=1 Tax=Coccidioides immitis (strain RS) TaxID=246410 RepID=A0A0D8JVH3_COCIM|nr:uncharacterized protein CIMG_13581 [Coccidioides immitis RS]KJF61330.1 hypothetical protein CIMG_13581 [Coccidioides immitis RS]